MFSLPLILIHVDVKLHFDQKIQNCSGKIVCTIAKLVLVSR